MVSLDTRPGPVKLFSALTVDPGATTGEGATIIGVCAGAKVVGAAGLPDGKRATTHWYYLGQLRKRSPRWSMFPTVGWWSIRGSSRRPAFPPPYR